MENSPCNSIRGRESRKDRGEDPVGVDAAVDFTVGAAPEFVAAFAERERFAGEEAFGVGVSQADAARKMWHDGHTPAMDGVGHSRKAVIWEFRADVDYAIANEGKIGNCLPCCDCRKWGRSCQAVAEGETIREFPEP
jgi:hypothetical protein